MVKTKRSKEFVKQLYRDIPRYIAGSINDRFRIRAVFWSTFTHHMYRQIHEGYELKADGGSDNLGNSWPKLSPKTIAQRPIGRGNLRQFGLTKRQSGTSFSDRSRGLLTPRENRLWNRIYVRFYFALRQRTGDREAKEIAARIAWTRVKRLGAKTKIGTLGSRDVKIMRETDRIYNSLRPSAVAYGTTYRPRNEQIVELSGNSLKLGTKVPYAKYHNGTRPVIPNNIKPWRDVAIEEGMRAVMRHIERTVL